MSTDNRALRLQVILSAIDKATAPLRSIGRQSKTAADELRGTRSTLRQLKAQQAAVTEFRTLQGALRGSAERLAAMRQRVDVLKAAHAGHARQARRRNTQALVKRLDRASAASSRATL